MRAGLTEAVFPFFGRLGESGRRELGALSSTRVRPKQHLLRRGDDAQGAYLVLEGALRVYYVTSEGREATLYAVEAGGTCVLAVTATFNHEPYPAWVQAGPAGATFVRIPSAVFRRLFDEERAFGTFVLGALSGRILELMRALEEAGSARLEERVARYLLTHADEEGIVRVSQVGIASELGTAREVVFRALRSLARRGLLETGRMRVTILDSPKLSELARYRQPNARS